MATSRVNARRPPLIGAIALSVGIAAVTNGALAWLGLNAPVEHWPGFAPRGPVIGIVWIVLFAGMGAAYWHAHSRPAVAGLIALCLAYPFYTHAFHNHLAELIGNLVTFAYAAWLAARLRTESATAAWLVGTVAAWIAVATALVIALVQLNGWAA